MLEIWKDHPLHIGYKISNLGRIKGPRGIRKLFKSHIGYMKIQLRNQKSYFVHRLVMEAFIGIKDRKIHVNHIDGNKENNYLSNLEYLSCGDNQKHAYDTGLRKSLKGTIRSDVSKLSKETGISTSTIYRRLAKGRDPLKRYRKW